MSFHGFLSMEAILVNPRRPFPTIIRRILQQLYVRYSGPSNFTFLFVSITRTYATLNFNEVEKQPSSLAHCWLTGLTVFTRFIAGNRQVEYGNYYSKAIN